MRPVPLLVMVAFVLALGLAACSEEDAAVTATATPGAPTAAAAKAGPLDLRRALIYQPSSRQERLVAEPPPEALLKHLRERNVEPLSIGRVIVEQHRTRVGRWPKAERRESGGARSGGAMPSLEASARRSAPRP